ncbi:conserved hypothetical protein [Staphylococcus aureus]|uniref:Uncharacterized protein n=1 Tax=Staphylococcus capitis TaxID=29388 RepID=T1T0F2_STACP|nr:hypothetical protein [Staphylococcus capitis]CDI72659.1 hypothetical protein CR01_20029 [Staphylococcus capitis CR01]CRI23932.1 conserved hypothetical protein [Staphylococcus aureus]CQD27176.1 hypothetical protein SCAPIOD150070 [Staphylococcus capitis]CQD31059.1 hypothetical protein SCAPIOD140049 [Staphylococcus capitis]
MKSSVNSVYLIIISLNILKLNTYYIWFFTILEVYFLFS